MSDLSTDNRYQQTLEEIKRQVIENQHRAAMAVNSRLLYTYWSIGQRILEDQKGHGWGAKIIQQLEIDLKAAFPQQRGFSRRNLAYMRTFAEYWPAELIVQPVAAQLQNPIVQPLAAQFPNLPFEAFELHPVAKIPWTSHQLLLDKLKTHEERLFYCIKTLEGGWSRRVLLNQLEQKRHLAQGMLPNNFANTLSPAQSELARDTFKDPYFFPFLQLEDHAREKDIEDALVNYIKDFLLELGAGFAYMGAQYKLEVGSKEYFLDLLFYHTRLRCYVVIDLKIDDFKPEYAGKLQFYLSALDDLVKLPEDKPSIGLILCKEANKIVAEYALRDTGKPIGVAEYRLVDELPEQFVSQLPSIQQLEAVLKQKTIP